MAEWSWHQAGNPKVRVRTPAPPGNLWLRVAYKPTNIASISVTLNIKFSKHTLKDYNKRWAKKRNLPQTYWFILWSLTCLKDFKPMLKKMTGIEENYGLSPQSFSELFAHFHFHYAKMTLMHYFPSKLFTKLLIKNLWGFDMWPRQTAFDPECDQKSLGLYIS